MAKWTFKPNNDVNNSMVGSIQYDSGSHKGDSTWQLYQDERPFLDEVKREKEAGQKANAMGHKKFATIPDIVAIEIADKHGIDIHDPTIMGDKHRMRRFKYIVMTEYPYLVVNNA